MFDLNQSIKSFLEHSKAEGYDNNLNVFKDFLDRKKISNNFVKEFLQGIRTETIIESLNFYIEDRGLTSIDTALRYISCIKEYFAYNFHAELFENKELAAEIAYPTYSEKSFRYKVNNFISQDKRLLERNDFVALDENEILSLIVDCDDTISSEKVQQASPKMQKYYNKFRSALIIKLIIFTGIRYEVLQKLPKQALDLKYNTIKVNGFTIHLPMNLRDQFFEYEKLLHQINTTDREYLFLEFDLNKISEITYATSGFLKVLTGRGDLNGVIKFTVIEMIKKGINESIIKKFTGVGEEMYNACQDFVNDYSFAKANRYLDSKIRSMNIFDRL